MKTIQEILNHIEWAKPMVDNIEPNTADGDIAKEVIRIMKCSTFGVYCGFTCESEDFLRAFQKGAYMELKNAIELKIIKLQLIYNGMELDEYHSLR